ncbi:hypothetical protein NET02_13070 [Thermomicrobiaceae bacterium CFH 74404]|uniref:Uncharacterized protein n=1 Tax=Thermalbibacter longus TaxID=2951981 RepID=A0AA41WBM3_9BACT|nr:hypothetical protein [Thermalbibacter longus]MCM8750079.1 hypothetical protein [Thermalbibacter longus]
MPVAQGSARRRRSTRSWYEVLFLAAAMVTGIGTLDLTLESLRNGNPERRMAVDRDEPG